MLQFLRRPGRHPAAIAVTALRLALALLIPAVVATTAGCGGDDDNDGAVDAGRDGGALAACKPSDCTTPMPTMQMCTTGTATFTCARNIDLRCAWVNPRCTVGNDNADAVGPSDGPQDAGVTDAGPEDASVDAAEDAGD